VPLQGPGRAVSFHARCGWSTSVFSYPRRRWRSRRDPQVGSGQTVAIVGPSLARARRGRRPPARSLDAQCRADCLVDGVPNSAGSRRRPGRAQLDMFRRQRCSLRHHPGEPIVGLHRDATESDLRAGALKSAVGVAVRCRRRRRGDSRRILVATAGMAALRGRASVDWGAAARAAASSAPAHSRRGHERPSIRRTKALSNVLSNRTSTDACRSCSSPIALSTVRRCRRDLRPRRWLGG